MANPEGANMNRKRSLSEIMESAAAARPGFLQRLPEQKPETAPPPSTTAAASRQASKMEKGNKKREFTTFIEKSLPPGDRD